MFVQNWLNSLPTATGGWLLFLIIGVYIARFIDGWKYIIQMSKIKRVNSAKSQSRAFINWAIFSDVWMIAWLMFKVKDEALFITGVFALLCVLVLFWTTYIYYDYRRYPRTKTITRPDILTYFINSILPNQKRKHL